MNWNIEEAQQKFRELLGAVSQEPQVVYNQDEVVAVVIEAGLFKQFLEWRQRQTHTSLADSFATLRQICSEEGYILETPARNDRPNLFA